MSTRSAVTVPNRILHAASYYGDTAGGVIPMILSLASEVRARGAEFALVAPRNVSATWHDKVVAVGAELILVDDAAGALRAIRAWNPDIVHIHFYGWEVALTAGLWANQVRLFWHVHSALAFAGRAPSLIRFFIKFRVIGSRVERFIAVSEALADELRSVGAPAARVVAVRNAVDTRRFRPPTSAERALARMALGLEGMPTILFFGWEPVRKGADVLFDALADLKSVTVLTVATPRETRDLLAQRAKVVSLERADDIVPLLWAADVLAVPSRAEGFGLVVLEAALAGLPVAASDLPAIREAAGGRPRVRFARVGDGADLALAMRELLALPSSDPQTDEPNDDLGDWAATVLRIYERQAAE